MIATPLGSRCSPTAFLCEELAYVQRHGDILTLHVNHSNRLLSAESLKREKMVIVINHGGEAYIYSPIRFSKPIPSS